MTDRTLAGAVLLVGVLALGPEHPEGGWALLVGVMLGFGILALVAGLFHD